MRSICIRYAVLGSIYRNLQACFLIQLGTTNTNMLNMLDFMPKTTGFGSMSDKNTCEGVDDSYSLRLQTGRCLSSGLKN